MAEWKSRTASTLNFSPAFQETAANGCILVNQVLTPTKSYEDKLLHKFLNLKFNCFSYYLSFLHLLYGREQEEHFYLSAIQLKMVKYTCLLLPTQPCHSYHYGQFTHRQGELTAIIQREICELLVWSFLPFTGWVLTELENMKCFTKPFSCHWFLLAFTADGPIFSLKRLTARGLMQIEGSGRCCFSLPQQRLLWSPSSWRHTSSHSENVCMWPLPTHKHSLSEL